VVLAGPSDRAAHDLTLLGAGRQLVDGEQGQAI
jgi:hypothetical protein